MQNSSGMGELAGPDQLTLNMLLPNSVILWIAAVVYPSDQPILTVIARWHSFEQKSYVRRIQDLSYV